MTYRYTLAFVFGLIPNTCSFIFSRAANPNPFEVRLAGGSNDAEGRVEVLHDGSWGTICDGWWDLRDARVVCRMLGFDGVLEAPRSARFGQGSGRVLLKYVNCEGTEDNLADCAHWSLFMSTYKGCRSHLLFWSTIIKCGLIFNTSSFIFSRAANPNLFEVRLAGGSNDAEGRVEVMHNGSWGTICDDLWDLRDARVVCRMLGFDGALEAPRSARFGEGSGFVLLRIANCEGTEDNLADCAHPGIGRYSYSCSHSRDAGAICYSGGIFSPPPASLFFEMPNPYHFRANNWNGSSNSSKKKTPISNYIPCFGTANPDLLQVRLAGGSNDAEGRVDVMHNGSWGTVCDINWDLSDARVVCKMLGFNGALEAPRSARFGQGSGRVLLNYVNCEGIEKNLADCVHAGISRYSCSQSREAGAVCYSGANPNPFNVRLAGGSNDAEGRVEVLHDGSWGTICDYDWDLRDAMVVCRMLGFDGALEAPRSGNFGQGSGPVLLTYVSCEGTERNLADCAHSGIERYPCSHLRDAGTVCFNGGHLSSNEVVYTFTSYQSKNSLNTTEPFQVRLTNGTTGSEGRVEVSYKASWGTICDDNWDLRDARVVCNMVGFDGALATPGSATFGAGGGEILFDDVDCKGTEDTIADCFHRGIGVNNCNHGSDAGVVCFRGGMIIQSAIQKHSGDGMLAKYTEKGGGILMILCSSDKQIQELITYTFIFLTLAAPFLVQLVNGSNDFEGRVEVMYEGSWGTICDDEWDLRDARVVCKMLKFDGALAAPGSATFGQGSGDILLDDVSCERTHDNLADCYHRGIGVSNCQHEEDSGAICFTGGISGFTFYHHIHKPFTVRLRNGSKASEGRVEIRYDGSWGTICGSSWDLIDARVVCRMLGFDGASEAPVSGEFGRGEGDIFLSDVQCDGTENSLADCSHAGIGVNNCNQAIDSGAICFSGVRLVGGTSNAEGRVEILHDGSWGTVCDDSWDLKDAEVVCRMLGFVGALEAPVGAHFGKGSGAIFLDEVQCNGTEIDLEHCDHDGIGVHNCAHNEDASVICIQPDLTTKFVSNESGIFTTKDFTQTTSPNLFQEELKIIIVYGVCIILSSVFVVVTLTYCIRMVRKKRAGSNLENEIYMDFQDIGLNKGAITRSTYQELNSPPKLPERPLTMIGQGSTMRSSGQRFNNHDERTLTHHDRKRDSGHEYTEMGTTTKTVSANKEEHSYAYNIHPTRSQEDSRESISNGQLISQNKPHEYMVMNTVYKKIDVGKDEDIDGYLLPSKTSETQQFPIQADYTKATMPADNDKISESSRPDYSEDENARLQKELQNTKRLSAHEYLNMTTFGQGISKENEMDTDGYLLPTVFGVSREMND
ncbi:deleted in malignant brain tumors 1 protein-like [Lytechinus variegatus]|uniref:deleted in malignant brain tumors 1 protein-like n=1 Tax=Lytechinus variegatus TaxID=7654 RepID=UPI001BB2929B|nr:deleted in malignant brain tumors 1 protein-like [Lytechinus variegatus]